MLEKNVTVKIPTGLEARTVAMFVQVASQFKSNVFVALGDLKVNGKSIMGMMSLGVLENEDIAIITDGEDETAAMAKIESYLLNNEA